MFDAMFATDAVLAETSGEAWLRALLRIEAALARAGGRVGLIPAGAVAQLEKACEPAGFDVAELARRAVGSATPVVPLVADLRARLPEPLRPYLHLGATSQDLIDTALVLVSRASVALIEADLAAGTDALARLADRHRDSVQPGRTLLQQAAPTSFGVVCAGWLVALDQARIALAAARDGLGLQYGGAVGVHHDLGRDGLRLAAALAEELGLPLPVLPWHVNRVPVARLAAALGAVTGALGTVALAVVLLSQNEIGELAEGEPGSSSALPGKRNPARSVLIRACAEQTPGLIATVFATLPGELQRAAGGWQAQWPALTTLLRLTAAAAAHGRVLLDGLHVEVERMAAHAAPQRAGVDLGAAGELVDRALAAHAAVPR